MSYLILNNESLHKAHNDKGTKNSPWCALPALISVRGVHVGAVVAGQGRGSPRRTVVTHRTWGSRSAAIIGSGRHSTTRAVVPREGHSTMISIYYKVILQCAVETVVHIESDIMKLR